MNLQRQIADIKTDPFKVAAGNNFTRILAVIVGLVAIAIGFWALINNLAVFAWERGAGWWMLVCAFFLAGGFLVYAAIPSRAAADLIANLESRILEVNRLTQDVSKEISRLEDQRRPIVAKIDHLTDQL